MIICWAAVFLNHEYHPRIYSDGNRLVRPFYFDLICCSSLIRLPRNFPGTFSDIGLEYIFISMFRVVPVLIFAHVVSGIGLVYATHHILSYSSLRSLPVHCPREYSVIYLILLMI